MVEINRFIKILMLVVSLSMQLTSVSAAEVRCIERERQALLKFKDDLADDGGFFSSWGNEEVKKECCKWNGVSCSNGTGHVVLLDLHASWQVGPLYLKSKLSPSLLELQHLNYLDLSSVDFRGSAIPRFFGSLKNLRHLLLSSSYFTGEVPCELGNLTNLHTLDLSGYNNLKIKNLEWLSHLSLLSYLDLSYVDLINQTSWLHHITRFPFLEELRLSRCQLPNPVPSFDIFSNSSLSRLSILDLSFNYLTSSFAFHWLFNSSASLTKIDLSFNQLQGPIPDVFGELIFLEELLLINNKFNVGIPKSLGNLSHLYYLDISYNELNGPLPDDNSKLKEFHPQSLGLPTSLVYLDLSYNQFQRLPEGIEKFSKLEHLAMSSNLLEDTITDLSNLANLKFLDLSNNSLASNLSSDWIPHFQLDTLLLSHCYSLGPHFPNWIQTQKTLVVLDLSFTGISGALPNWLWDMFSLDYIDLSLNNISGKIPNLSPKLVHFKTIDLSYNKFSGPIPLFLFHSMDIKLSKNMFSGSIFHLCTIPKDFIIEIIDLSDNQLEGELPNCWMNISDQLVVLDFANNKFSGEIPLTLGTLDQLQVLHLRDNNFIGALPSTLSNCKWLNMLDVGGNKLTGKIPAWIGKHLTNLIVLSLRSNEFDGIMPSTICRLTNIHVLDLSRNNISGRISRCLNNFTALVQKNGSIEDAGTFYNPLNFNERLGGLYVNNAFVQWKRQELEYRKLGLLKFVDFSCNKLVGTIPQEFSALKSLVSLNLSRNHLTGTIISKIGQMEMLECLDLSGNQLSGKIPNSLAYLNFLGVLDLSYNNLTGKIPLGTQLQGFDSSVYAGNSQLCGKPLAECPGDISNSSKDDHGKGNIFEEDDGFITRDFYICMAFGFITSFWVVVTNLALKHSWRQSCFNWWNNVGYWIYVYVTRFKRKFMM